MANGWESTKKLHNLGTGGDKPISCYSLSNKVLATTMDSLPAFRTSEGEMDYFNSLTQSQPASNISNLRFKRNGVDYTVTTTSRLTTSHSYMGAYVYTPSSPAAYPYQVFNSGDSSYNGPTGFTLSNSNTYSGVNVYSSVNYLGGSYSGGYGGSNHIIILQVYPVNSPSSVLTSSTFTYFSWTRISTVPSGATNVPSASSGIVMGLDFNQASTQKGFYLLQLSPGVYDFTFYTKSGDVYGALTCHGYLAQ